MASYTQPQVKALGQAELLAIPTTTWASFTSDQLGYFDANQIHLIPDLSIAAINPANIGGFTSDAMKQMQQSQIQHLTQPQLNTLTTVSHGAAKIQDFTDAQFGYITQTQMPWLQASLFGVLTTSEIQHFDSVAFSVLSLSQFGYMTDAARLNGLFGTSALYNSLSTTNGINCFGALTPTQLSELGNNVTQLTLLQLATIPYAVFGGISAGVLGTFSVSVGNNQVANITSQQFTALTATQINALGANVSSVKSAAIGQLDSSVNHMADLSANVIHALTATQLQTITNSVNLQVLGTKLADSQYTSDMSNNQFSLLSSTQVSSLSAGVVASLSAVVGGRAKMQNFDAAHLGYLTYSQMDSIHDELFSVLETAQINGFSAESFKGLKVSQFGQMTDSVRLNGIFSSNNLYQSLLVDGSGNNCFGSLTPTQLGVVAGSVTRLSLKQLAAIPDATFGSISPSVLATFSVSVENNQVANIKSSQFTALTATQINALGANVSSVKPAAIGELDASNNRMQDLSANLIHALTATQLQTITNSVNLQVLGTKLADSQYTNDMSNNQFSLLSSTQVSRLSAGVVASLSAVVEGRAKMQNFDAAHLGYLTYSQMASIHDELFGVLETAQINGFSAESFKGLKVSQFGQMNDSVRLNGIFSTNNLYQSLLVDGSGNNCFGSVSVSQVHTIGSNITNLSASQISAIPPVSFAAIANSDMATIASGAKSLAITPDQLHQLSATQINNNVVNFQILKDTCAPSLAQFQDASGGVLTITDDVKNTLKMNQVRSLNYRCIPYISQANVDYLTKAQFDALKLDSEVMASVPGNVGKAFITNILSFSPADIHAMNVDANINSSTSRPPVYQLALMSSEQVAQLTSNAVNALSATQFNALPYLGNLDKDTVIPNLTASFLTTLDGSGNGFVGYNSLVTPQCAKLTAQQVSAITNSASKVALFNTDIATAILNNVNVSSFNNIGSVSAAAFGTNFTNAANLSSGDARNAQIKALTPAQFAQLSGTSVSALPAEKFGDISANCFGPSFAQEVNITVDQASNMKHEQVQVLTGKASPHSLSAQPAQKLLNNYMSDISLNYYQYISADAFGVIGSGPTSSTFTNGAGINASVAAKLSVAQIQKIPTAAFVAIPASGFVNLRSDAFVTPGFTNIPSITTAQATYVSTPSVVGLTAAQITAMGSSATTLTNAVLATLTFTQVTAFTSAAIQGLTQTQIGVLQPDARTIVYAVQNNSITSLNINVDSFNPTDVEATEFDFAKVAEDVSFNADITININMSAADAAAAFQYRRSSSGTTDLFFNKSAFAVKYSYAPTAAVKIDSAKCTDVSLNTTVKYTYPNTQWIGPTAPGISNPITGETGLPASWEYMLYSAQKLFGFYSAYDYFNDVYGYEKDLRSRLNAGINGQLTSVFTNYSSDPSDNSINAANKVRDASGNYYTVLNNNVGANTSNFMSYIFDYMNSRQPSRFVSVGDNTALNQVYGYPFLANDTLNFIVGVIPNAHQPVYGSSGGAPPVPKRTYKITIKITA
jgi:trimeric autotransporter adhesin